MKQFILQIAGTIDGSGETPKDVQADLEKRLQSIAAAGNQALASIAAAGATVRQGVLHVEAVNGSHEPSATIPLGVKPVDAEAAVEAAPSVPGATVDQGSTEESASQAVRPTETPPEG